MGFPVKPGMFRLTGGDDVSSKHRDHKVRTENTQRFTVSLHVLIFIYLIYSVSFMHLYTTFYVEYNWVCGDIQPDGLSWGLVGSHREGSIL